MDFESYIGKERQLLGRIEKERAELNSHEPNAWEGNFRLAADEIKLLKAGDYVNHAAERAADAVGALDERMGQLKRLEGNANARNEAFLKRVADWETKFDARYAEAMAAMAREMTALETHNAELTRRIEAAEHNLAEIGSTSEKNVHEIGDSVEWNLRQSSERTEAGIREMSEKTEANLKELHQATAADIDRLVSSLKSAQAEFEASVNEKLEQDRQTLERIKYMITAMNEIIKT